MATKPARPVSLPVAGERVERADAARNRERILQAALLLALLDEHERELQDAILEGEPPLGPGAPAARRLLAFGEALLDLTLDHLELLLGSETTAPLARTRTGAYAVWHLHLAALLPELRPDADPNVLADVILALYDAELQQFLAEERDPRAVRELLLDSVRRLAGIRRPSAAEGRRPGG